MPVSSTTKKENVIGAKSVSYAINYYLSQAQPA